jgi:hypothetical protein
MNRRLDAAARVRLARLLGMLGSSHDGEVGLVNAAGVTWLDVVGPAPRKRQTAARRKAQPAKAQRLSWEQIAQQILATDRATPWERSFCESLLRHWRHRRPSERQLSTLTTISRERCASEAA